MKFGITKNFKLWIIITLAVIVAGMFILGFAGFNKTVDYKLSYQVKVDVEEDSSSSVEIAKQVTNEFFKENGIHDVDYAITVGDDGTVVYKFHSDVADKIEGLEARLQDKFTEKGISLVAEVTAAQSNPYVSTDVLGICLAAGVSAVAILIYLMIMEKPASAFAVLGSAIISALLFISLTVITRVPALPFAVAGTAFSALICAVLSMLFVGKAREEVKNIANEKMSNGELADKACAQNAVSLIGILAVCVFSAIVLLIIGTGYLKYLGIQIALAGISATFSAGAWTPLIWSTLKKRKTKKVTAEEDQ